VNLGSEGDSMEPTRKQPPSAIYEEVDSLATNVGSSPIARSTSSSVRFRRLQILSDEESRGRDAESFFTPLNRIPSLIPEFGKLLVMFRCFVWCLE